MHLTSSTHTFRLSRGSPHRTICVHSHGETGADFQGGCTPVDSLHSFQLGVCRSPPHLQLECSHLQLELDGEVDHLQP